MDPDRRLAAIEDVFQAIHQAQDGVHPRWIARVHKDGGLFQKAHDVKIAGHKALPALDNRQLVGGKMGRVLGDKGIQQANVLVQGVADLELVRLGARDICLKRVHVREDVALLVDVELQRPHQLVEQFYIFRG